MRGARRRATDRVLEGFVRLPMRTRKRTRKDRGVEGAKSTRLRLSGGETRERVGAEGIRTGARDRAKETIGGTRVRSRRERELAVLRQASRRALSIPFFAALWALL